MVSMEDMLIDAENLFLLVERYEGAGKRQIRIENDKNGRDAFFNLAKGLCKTCMPQATDHAGAIV